jgi:trehalose 6-phosphate synthase
MRSELALAGARQALVTAWRSDDRDGVRSLLTEIARDERIMAAAACDTDGARIAVTRDYPAHQSCRDFLAEVRPDPATPGAPWRQYGTTLSMRGGGLHVSALPVVDRDDALGFVVLLHDMSFAERREASTLRFLLLGFALLAAAVSVLTFAASRLWWRGWTREMGRFLRGDADRPEFQPLLKDVRTLLERLSDEREADGHAGAWTPQRLRQTLTRYLHGERVIMVANREPYVHEHTADGGTTVLHPASGLVTALEPVMRACSGVWIGHGSGSADQENADVRGRVAVPPGEESYLLRRIWLTREQEQGYSYGFANEGLWPLCHIAHARPAFRSDDWQHYQTVNRIFADAVCEEVDRDDPIILVQDYHLALVPAYLRARLPRATILSFWHIPWPNAERLGICPWREELLEGLLGSSIVGFHTQAHCNNFLGAVDTYLEARIDRERLGVVQRRQTTLVRAYPISIEWPHPGLVPGPPRAPGHPREHRHRAVLPRRPDQLRLGAHERVARPPSRGGRGPARLGGRDGAGPACPGSAPPHLRRVDRVQQRARARRVARRDGAPGGRLLRAAPLPAGQRRQARLRAPHRAGDRRRRPARALRRRQAARAGRGRLPR